MLEKWSGLSRGFSVIEILLTLLILAGGLLAMLNLHSALQTSLSGVKTQAEAVVLAEKKIHELASYLSMSDARLAAGAYAAEVIGTLASFDQNWTITVDEVLPGQKNLAASVTWLNRTGLDQDIVFHSQLFVRSPTESITNLLEHIAWSKNPLDQNVWGSP